jgi:hypothetical protein
MKLNGLLFVVKSNKVKPYDGTQLLVNQITQLTIHPA